MNKHFLVFDAGDGGSVSQETPPADGSVPNGTPPTPAQDAEKVALEAKLAEQSQMLSKYEEDVRRIKSTFQRNEAQMNQKLEQREHDFKAQMDTLRRSLLDEDALKLYEVEYAKASHADLERQYNEAQSALAQERALRQTVSLFVQEGIPVEVLLKAEEGGLEEVTQAAWKWLFDERKRLSEATKTTPKSPPAPPPTAPSTSTETAPAFKGPTWADLIKQYGSREVVYSLVEAQRLPPTIIPVEG